MKKTLSVLCLGILLLAAGCRSAGGTQTAPISEPEQAAPVTGWDASTLENELGGPDPLEGFNRSMFACTDFLMNYLVDPVGRIYTTIFPRPFIEHFHTACLNLEYPARAVSCLLRKEWEGAGDETIRFFGNTTLGFAGFLTSPKPCGGFPRPIPISGRPLPPGAWGPDALSCFPCSQRSTSAICSD